MENIVFNKLPRQICFIWFSYEDIQNIHIVLIYVSNHMRIICILLHMISICLFIWFSYDLPHMILIWLDMHMIHICFSYDSHMKGNTYVYHMWWNCLCSWLAFQQYYIYTDLHFWLSPWVLNSAELSVLNVQNFRLYLTIQIH